MEDVKQVEEVVDSKIGELAAITQQGFLEMQQGFDKLASIVLNHDETLKSFDQRMSRMEGSQEKMFDKIDGFLTVLNCHESEIAGLSDHGRRSDERIAHLEARA